MFEITFGGRKIRPEDFGKELKKVAAKQIAEELQARISSIRNPVTGEFPVVVAVADSLDELYIRAEGSPELIQFVRERMSEEDLQLVRFQERTSVQSKAFLSYAWEDRELAGRVAERLQANGVDTWWAEWEIRAGDSLRRKIDEGLSNCTHFLVLLTPASIEKPWVNQEMDAGFVRKIEAQARFIPLRSGLATSALPPLLRPILSPEIRDFDRDMAQLVNDIHNVLRKPPLGPAPIPEVPGNTGYSAAANRVAEIFVRASKTGDSFDPQFGHAKLAEQAGLTSEDLSDALHELRNFITDEHYWLHPKEELFVEFDAHFMPWNPAADALQLATDLLNDDNFPSTPPAIAERYGWEARQLNPAINYLKNRNLAGVRTALGMGPWAAFHIEKTDATRRFLKSRT
jgi:hypothetical protein